MKIKYFIIFGISFIAFSFSTAFAQNFEISGQIRPRTEYKHGYKSLIGDNVDAAFSTSQRTRLNLNYSTPKIQTHISLQNIGIWGEGTTSSKSDKAGTSIFQAWGEFFVTPEFSIKAGRQLFMYDDQKVLSQSDWSQAGRRHDGMLFKYELPKFKVHLGAAYNQDTDKDTGTFYSTKNYKTMQFIWMHYDLNKFGASLYFINNGMPQNVIEDSVSHQRIRFSQTVGPLLSWKDELFNLQGAFYYQMGKNDKNKDLDAFLATFEANFNIYDNIVLGVGTQYATGNNQDEVATKDKYFTLPFTSGHKFQGSMDYFYSSSSHENVGIIDVYLPFNLNFDKLKTNLTAHYFMSPANIVDAQGKLMDKYLGTEIDLQFTYKFSKELSILCGYSHMFGTQSLQEIKGGNYQNTQNWAWLAFSFTPSIFKN